MAYDSEIFKQALDFAKAYVASGEIDFNGVPAAVDRAYAALEKIYEKYGPRPDYSAYDGEGVIPTEDNCPF